MLLIRIIFFITHVVTLKSENQFDFYVQCADKYEFNETCNTKDPKKFNKILRANRNYQLYNSLKIALSEDDLSDFDKQKNDLITSTAIKSIFENNGETIQKNNLNSKQLNEDQKKDIENLLNKAIADYIQYRKIFDPELQCGKKIKFSLSNNMKSMAYESLVKNESDIFIVQIALRIIEKALNTITIKDRKKQKENLKSILSQDFLYKSAQNTVFISAAGIIAAQEEKYNTDHFSSIFNHFTKKYNYKKTKKYLCSELIKSIERKLDYLETTYNLDLNNKQKIEIPYNTTTKNNFVPFYSVNLHQLFEKEHFYDVNDHLAQKIESSLNLLAAIKIQQKLQKDCSYCVPKITEKSDDIIIKDVFLPSVISYNSKNTEPIKNSITFKQNHYKNYFLVSPIGSGKSVLMSALGLNIKYLSKIGIVSCKDFSIPANLKLLDFTIHSKKTLGAGVSDGMNAKNIFSHQIKKVHNILNQNKKVLFITDEPLRETTPKDSTPYYLKNMEPLWENNNFNSITITHNDNLVKTVYPQLFYNALDSYKKKAAFLLQEQLEKIIDPTYQPYIPGMKKKYENIGLLYFKTQLNNQGRFSTFKLDIDKNFDSPENFWFTDQKKREQYEQGQNYLKQQKKCN